MIVPSAISVGESLALTALVPGIDWSGETDCWPKDRHRARVVTPKDRRPWVQFYDTDRNEAWEEHVGTTVLAQLRGVRVDGDRDFTLPLRDKRVMMTLRFYMRKPISYPKRVIHDVRKPDVDNLAKGVIDGLVKGGILEDDNCITDLVVCKRYADEFHPVGVEIELTCLAV